MTDRRRGFLRRIKARMRLAWLSATAQRIAPVVGLAVVVLVAVDWLTPFDRGLLVALILCGVCIVGLLVGAALIRISTWDASRAAERGLGARDALTTALEFVDPDDSVHQVIQEKADAIARDARPAEAIPITANRPQLRQFGTAAALALVIGLLPPLGSSPALSADIESALEAEAEQIEQIAEAVKEADVETADDIVAELERLAEELRRAESLEDALRSLEDAEKRLAEQADPGFLAQKAAVQGLARDLALRPLASGPVDASSQLDQLADDLDSLSEPELAALEDRLADLAESQASGNPGLSSQLSDAAQALSSGDLQRAAQSLRDAAANQQSGLDGARGQQALSETQRALEGARSRLGGAADPNNGEGEGEGPGEGQGQGEGEGEGQGAGQGQGEGQGQGQGGGRGAGQPAGGSGQITGVAPGDGDAAGQGGQGSVGASDGDQDHGTGVESADVFSPIDEGALSDLIQVGIDGGSGQGDVLGRADAPTTRGESVVPYAQVLPEYLNQAADALGELQLPPSMRGIVQNYFDLLAEQAR